MRKHRDHIMTAALREVYDFLIEQGELDRGFDVSENEPKGKNRKKAVKYNYAGRRSNPFSFIVNSGERKEYHLFYIRLPRKGDQELVENNFDNEKININGKGEITIQIHNIAAAKSVWELVNRIRLQ